MVSQDPPSDTLQLAICGGGIVGLTLAIGLKERLGLTADVFEACDGFANDVGAGKPHHAGIFYDRIPIYFDVSFPPDHSLTFLFHKPLITNRLIIIDKRNGHVSQWFESAS